MDWEKEYSDFLDKVISDDGVFEKDWLSMTGGLFDSDASNDTGGGLLSNESVPFDYTSEAMGDDASESFSGQAGIPSLSMPSPTAAQGGLINSVLGMIKKNPKAAELVAGAVGSAYNAKKTSDANNASLQAAEDKRKRIEQSILNTPVRKIGTPGKLRRKVDIPAEQSFGGGQMYSNVFDNNGRMAR